jgi:hypothetical protein
MTWRPETNDPPTQYLDFVGRWIRTRQMSHEVQQ